MKTLSLRARLRWMIILVLVAVLLPLGLLSFRRTIAEVDELSDGRLAQAARTIDVLVGQAGIASLHGQDDRGLLVPISARPSQTLVVQGHSYESEVGFQVFDAGGHLRLASTNLMTLPAPAAGSSGFRDLRLEKRRWRVFTLVNANGVVIRAGERYDSRHEIMRAVLLEHGLPLLIGLPLMALLVGWAVKRGLRPLDALARALAEREPGSREHVLVERPPAELKPLLDALNSQLERLEDALERERRFSSDVAHELRTPLASTLINLDSAMAMRDTDTADMALHNARNSVTFLARRIEQLLSLARLESGAASSPRSRIDLGELAIEVVEELAPTIADSGVELGFAPPAQPVVVSGYESGLVALLRNLVENALRHLPAGGQVQLSISRDALHAYIDVIDDGPGIPAESRAAVFSRFRREPGSRGDGYGLGLSIVQRAAQLHEARLELLDAPCGRGLRVHVAMALAADADRC